MSLLTVALFGLTFPFYMALLMGAPPSTTLQWSVAGALMVGWCVKAGLLVRALLSRRKGQRQG